MTDTDGTLTEYSGKWWMGKLRSCGKELDEKWRNSADKVVDRYLDERTDSNMDTQKKYNIFWANVQILKSALYAQPPKPSVVRQNGDAKDDVARVAAMILERMLRIDFEKDDCDMHTAFELAVEDRLIPGLGQLWLRYEAEIEEYEIPPVIDPMTQIEISPATKAERIVDEWVDTEYVHWRDYFWSPARTWSEVWWQARRVWMGRKAFVKRFGEAKYKELKEQSNTIREVDGKLPKGFKDGKVEIFEIWCEETNKVYWVTDLMEEVLDEKDDPLQLENFFPCPQPLLGTHTTRSLIPRPDYVMSQDQYSELDTLNDRIATLTRALRVVGVYDKTNTELKSLLTGSEFNMIPVDNWAAFAEMGGMKGSIDWFPVEQIAQVLERLTAQRAAVIGQIYELSGISDIMRGSSNPRETAKAQQLKAQYSSVRLQLIQQAVGKFVRSAMRIKAEIICKHFQPQTIARQSQIEFTESVMYAEPAIQLLKDTGASKYRIEVDEQSLSIADYNTEREMRIELVTSVGQFLSQSAVMVKETPGSLPYLLRIIQWVVASFRGSSDVETVLDEAIDAITKAPPQPPEQGKPAPPPPPDPQVVEQARAQGAMMVQQAKTQSQLQINQATLQGDLTKINAQAKADLFVEKNKPQPPRPTGGKK